MTNPSVRNPAVGQILAKRIQEVRKLRGMTRRELAARATAVLGRPLSEQVVKAIETNKGGERAANVSVAELFALAAALNIGPAHLLTPVDDSELVSAPGVPELRADNLRAWVRGMLPLDWREWADFLRAWPDSELRRELRLGQRRGVQVRVSPAPSGAIEGGFGESLPQELDPFLNPKAEELADAAAWEITHGEAVRRGLEDATPDIRHAEERDPERKETENNG